jgi:hypothetical protein
MEACVLALVRSAGVKHGGFQLQYSHVQYLLSYSNGLHSQADDNTKKWKKLDCINKIDELEDGDCKHN